MQLQPYVGVQYIYAAPQAAATERGKIGLVLHILWYDSPYVFISHEISACAVIKSASFHSGKPLKPKKIVVFSDHFSLSAMFSG